MNDIKFHVSKTRSNASNTIKFTLNYRYNGLIPFSDRGIHVASGWKIYEVDRYDVVEWIETQRTDMWVFMPTVDNRLRYRMSPELEAWFLMRWS